MYLFEIIIWNMQLVRKIEMVLCIKSKYVKLPNEVKFELKLNVQI